MTIREMTIGDYDNVMELLSSSTGIRLRDADSCEATARYLERNTGLSFIAEDNGKLIGCVTRGHDGQRGYLQHPAMSETHR